MAEPLAIVTGASSGIGLSTARGLAAAGMRVVMVARDPDRTEAARRLVAAQAPSPDRIETALAEFASLAQVRRLADELLTRCARIDVLVNNAGLISPHYRQSEDGYEMTFAVNHLAPFLLTNLLLERIMASAPARIITVASMAHRGARLDLDDIAAPKDWGSLRAYGRSKLCNILFTRELARRLDGTGVVASCLHPGIVATGIGQRGGFREVAWRIAKPFMVSAEKGAETPIFLATIPDPGPFNGAYVIDKAVAAPDPAALDADLARRLWDLSARLVGI